MLATLRQQLTLDRLRGPVAGMTGTLDYGTAAHGGLLTTECGTMAPFWLDAICGALLLPMVWNVFSDKSVASAQRSSGSEA